MNPELIVLGCTALIASAWIYAFRVDLGDRWNDWRLDRAFRRKHRRDTR